MTADKQKKTFYIHFNEEAKVAKIHTALKIAPFNKLSKKTRSLQNRNGEI